MDMIFSALKFFQRILAAILKRLFRFGFGIPLLRQEAAFVIKHTYFSNLQLSLPVASGYQCPLDDSQAWLSFSEVFIEQAYAEAFRYIPYPKRWVDVGCHRGYFSLYLLSKMGKESAKNAQALLIDADPRSRAWVASLIKINHLEMQFFYHLGLVSDKQEALQNFACREGMLSSSKASFGPVGQWVEVPRLETAMIFQNLPPPYDLIKVDIEGAEEAFIDYYGPVLEASQALLLEWHQPLDIQQPLVPQALEEKLAKKLALYGFYLKVTLQDPTWVSIQDLKVYTGLGLWVREQKN